VEWKRIRFEGAVRDGVTMCWAKVEHKVDFIRETEKQSRMVENWIVRTGKPNPTHVLYGLEILSCWVSLRTNPNSCCCREKCPSGRSWSQRYKEKDMLEHTKNDFEILELASLRQMLSIQFRKFADEGQLKVPYEIERVIDDFIFMCMLVGNDFLPHFPSLEIDGGALSLMMSNYVDLLPVWGGYLTKKEAIHPDRLEQFMYNLAVYEEEHFKRRGYEENETGFKLESSKKTTTTLLR
jgi:5'-3' exoribonuclease 1